MNRLTRITATQVQLQSNTIVTANGTSERFEVSLRTLYIDIKTNKTQNEIRIYNNLC